MQTKIKILFLSANPDKTTQLKLTEECNLIDSKIQASEFRDQFQLEQRHAVSILDLQSHLLRFKPNIVHFSGHGDTKGGLVLESSNGFAEVVSQKALSSLFRIINESAPNENSTDNRVRCVLLNACYSIEQAKAISQYVDCVIGISDAIKDKSAINFAASFYQALGFGQSIETAFELGRNQLEMYNNSDENILVLTSKENIDPSKIFLARENTTIEYSDHSVSDVLIRDIDNEKRKNNLSNHCRKLLEESQLEELSYGIKNYTHLLDLIIFDTNIEKYTIGTSYIDPEIPTYRYSKQLFGHLYTSHRDLFDLVVESAKHWGIVYTLTMERLDKIREPVRRVLSDSGVKLDDPPRNLFIEPASNTLEGLLWSIIDLSKKSDPWKFIYDHDKYPNPLKYTDGKAEGSMKAHFKLDESSAKKLVPWFNDLVKNIHDTRTPLSEAEDRYSEVYYRCMNSFEAFFADLKIGTTTLNGGCHSCLSSEFHDEKEIEVLRVDLMKIPFE